MDESLLHVVLGLVVVAAAGLFVRAALRGGAAMRRQGDRQRERMRAESAAARAAAAAAAGAAVTAVPEGRAGEAP